MRFLLVLITSVFSKLFAVAKNLKTVVMTTGIMIEGSTWFNKLVIAELSSWQNSNA